MAELRYFPPEFLMLQHELIENHMDLMEKLKLQDVQLEEALGILAAEFDILCDGVYELADISKVLLIALQRRRTILILPPNFSRN